MTIFDIIGYISIFFWLFPPVRQFGGNYFYYFFILALSDPISWFCINMLGITNSIVHPIAGMFLIYSINTKEMNIRKYWHFHLLFIVLFLIGFILLYNRIILVLILHLIILIRFIKLTTLTLFNLNTINIFYLVLTFYELITVINLIIILSGNKMMGVFFYTSLLLQTLIAVFFTIFREESQYLKIRLKTAS